MALNAAAIVIAAAALWLSLDANELARRALSDQQIAGAWQILANKAPGATGKQYALGILLSPGANLQSLDLGCTRTLTANVLSKCQDSVDLSNLTLSGGDQSASLGAANLEGADLFRAHISDIEMLSVNMRNVDLSGALFERVSFRYVTFAGATIQLTTFRDVILEHVNFSHTNLSGLSVTATSAQYINVSGAVLCATSLECMDADRGVWNAAYYFRDDPPKGLEFLPANIPTPSSCGSPTTNQDYIELICD